MQEKVQGVVGRQLRTDSTEAKAASKKTEESVREAASKVEGLATVSNGIAEELREMSQVVDEVYRISRKQSGDGGGKGMEN